MCYNHNHANEPVVNLTLMYRHPNTYNRAPWTSILYDQCMILVNEAGLCESSNLFLTYSRQLVCYSLFCLPLYPCLPFRNACIGCKLIVHFNVELLLYSIPLLLFILNGLTHKDVLCCLYYG